ncbi:286_t:CDS:2, partial [Ambispora gerdemannii]
MNEVYTFTSELINDHLEQHNNRGGNPVELQLYCPFCLPPPEEYTLTFQRFWLWYHTTTGSTPIHYQTTNCKVAEYHPVQRISHHKRLDPDGELSDEYYSETVDAETQIEEDNSENETEELNINEEVAEIEQEKPPREIESPLTKAIQKQGDEQANNISHITALLAEREYLAEERKRTHVNEAEEKDDLEKRHEEKEKAKGTVEFLVENEINEIEVGEEGSKKDELEQIIIQTEELTQEIQDKLQQKQIGITEQLFQILELKPVQSTP